MTPPGLTQVDRLYRVETDLEHHSLSITKLNELAQEGSKQQALQAQRETYLDERLGRIEASITALADDTKKRFNKANTLGWAALTTLITTGVAGAATFVIKGGLNIVGGP